MINGLNRVNEWTKKDFERACEKASQFLCPFAEKGRQVTMHHDHRNLHTPPLGIYAKCDTDVAYHESFFDVCQGPRCMAYDIETHTCKRCNP